MPLSLTSPAFENGGEIPSVHTCEGKDTSPPLAWSGVPSGAKSLALIVDDPDAPDPKAPKMTWVHWVLYGLARRPPGAPARPAGEGAPAPARARASTTGSGPATAARVRPLAATATTSSCTRSTRSFPTSGTPTKAKLEKAMEGHVREKVELMGTYQKQR